MGNEIKTEEEQTRPAEKITFLQIYCAIGSGVALVVSIVAMVMYMSGSFSVFGRDMTIVSAAELILKVFNMNSAIWYRSIFGMVLGVLYYALLLVMCKCLYFVIASMVRLLSRRQIGVMTARGTEKRFPVENYFRRSVCECLCIFEMLCIFLVMGAATTELVYTRGTIALFIAFGVVAVMRAIGGSIARKDKVAGFILDAIKAVFLHASVCLLAFLLTAPCVKTFIEGFSVLLNGNLNTSGGIVRIAIYSLYSSLAVPILLFILDIFFLRLLHVYSEGLSLDLVQRKTMIVLLVIMALGLIFRCIFVSVTGSVELHTFTVWLGMIKDSYLPMLLLSLTLLLLCPIYGREDRTL